MCPFTLSNTLYLEGTEYGFFWWQHLSDKSPYAYAKLAIFLRHHYNQSQLGCLLHSLLQNHNFFATNIMIGMVAKSRLLVLSNQFCPM